MTNKLRRSMTSVLLAASLLFSSQSVVAFADYGSKSDASDLSPVQESVENATEEQQEDPSLSVEPVIGESTEAPVAAPMMARANAPVAYSAPSVDENRYESSQLDDDSIVNDAVIRIYQTKNISRYGEPVTLDASSGDTFMQGSGYRVYTANQVPEWVFKGWSYSLIHDGKSLGNATDNVFGLRYAFSQFDPNNILPITNWYNSYDNTPTSPVISVNRLTWQFELMNNPLYYTLYANYNPLVTVNVGENGSVTAELTQHEDKYEVEYGNSATFTITPNPGYEVDTVKVNGSPVEFTEVSGGNYTLSSVTEPTTLEVTFDKTEEQPFWTFKADENGSVKWNDKEPTNSIVFTKSEVEKLKGNDGIKDFIYAVPDENYGFAGWETSAYFDGTANVCLENMNSEDPITATATFNPLVNVKFDAGEHGELVNPDEANGQITSNQEVSFDDTYRHHFLSFPEINVKEGYRLIGWTSDRTDGAAGKLETGSVSRPVEYVPEGITYTAQYEKIPAEKITDVEIEIGKTLQTLYPDLVNLWKRDNLHAEYNGGYIFLGNSGNGSSFETSVLGDGVGKIPDSLTTEIDTVDEAKGIFSGFTFMSKLFFPKEHFENDIINSVRVEGTKIYITLELPAPEAPANINDLLDVTLNCENPDHPEEYAKSKTYSDLLANSYTIGEVKNNDGTYTCDITINPEEYLADYNNVTKTNHILVTTPENLTGIATVTLKYEDGAWKTAESPVTFTVTCKQSIPLTPSKPSDDDVKAIMDKISVTVDCTNTTGHDPMNHTLTGAEFTVGDIYSVAPFADQDPDPVILCPVTINNYVSLQNGFITQYNAATNEPHTLSSGFIPASIVLTYNKDAQDGKGAWENHDLENITLSLTCNPTTPGGGGEGTNPGGNGGDNDDDDDRYTGGNTVTRTINDDDVPLNDRPNNTTTIDDEDVPLADLPDDTVTIDDGEVPLKANPSTGDSLPFAAMAAAALSLGGVIVLNRKKK